jgi:hypothetical protein
MPILQNSDDEYGYLIYTPNYEEMLEQFARKLDTLHHNLYKKCRQSIREVGHNTYSMRVISLTSPTIFPQFNQARKSSPKLEGVNLFLETFQANSFLLLYSSRLQEFKERL